MKGALIVIGIGDGGFKFVKIAKGELLDMYDEVLFYGIDTKLSSNHYVNKKPDFIDKNRFVFIDYSFLTRKYQLERIPNIDKWFNNE